MAEMKSGIWNSIYEKLRDEMVWWYKEPAAKYWEGLPIGTGRFAAMIHGTPAHELLTFNDETLWSGSPGSETLALSECHLPLRAGWAKCPSLRKKVAGVLSGIITWRQTLLFHPDAV